MRKLFVGAISALLLLSACKDEGAATKENDKAQKNLEAARTVAKAFETGDAALLDGVVAEDFIDHTERGEVKGRDSLKAMVNMLHANMKDMKMEAIREVADDDYVFQWMRYTGTSDGSMGMPPGPYDMKVVEVARMENGMVKEHWAYMDMSEMMKMMGAPPPGAMPPAMDSSKMMDHSKMK